MASNLREINGNVTAQDQPIQHDGDLLVRRNVTNGGFIIAQGNIEVLGDVVNSKIKSVTGSVKIHGGIKGISTEIQAYRDIEASFITNSTLKAGHNIVISDLAVDARVIARNSVSMERGEGVIEGGEIEAGTDIVANIVGTEEKTPTIVRITNFKQAELYSSMLKYEKESEEIKKEMAETERLIEVIKLLGKRVVQLPMEKKQDLAMKIKRYNDLGIRAAELELEKTKLFHENNQNEELDRAIIVHRMLFDGVYVYIDRTKLITQERFKKVILYKKGIIIIGDFDEFMRRKKYA